METKKQYKELGMTNQIIPILPITLTETEAHLYAEHNIIPEIHIPNTIRTAIPNDNSNISVIPHIKPQFHYKPTPKGENIENPIWSEGIL